MGARDYMPTTDEGFDTFQDNFIAGVQPHLSEWDIPHSEFTELVSLTA